MVFSAFVLAASLASAQTWAPDGSRLVEKWRTGRAADLSAVAAALRSPQGVAAVELVFERALGQGLRLSFERPVVRISGDAWLDKTIAAAALVPETGGRAWLVGGKLVLVPAGEPALDLMRALAAAPEDPAAAAFAYARDPGTSERLDGGSNGHMLKLWLEKLHPSPLDDKSKAVLGRIVLSVLETGSERYPFDQPVGAPRGGVPVGLWHLHPPRIVGGALSDADVPGAADGGPQPTDGDRSVAAASGVRNLTLCFRKDGFDAYDVDARGIAKIASYRSPVWAGRFAPALARLIAP